MNWNTVKMGDLLLVAIEAAYQDRRKQAEPLPRIADLNRRLLHFLLESGFVFLGSVHLPPLHFLSEVVDVSSPRYRSPARTECAPLPEEEDWMGIAEYPEVRRSQEERARALSDRRTNSCAGIERTVSLLTSGATIVIECILAL